MTINQILQNPAFKNKKVLKKIISHILNISKEDIYKNQDKKISNEDYKKIVNLYNQYVIDKKPLEYILWYVEMFGQKFLVNQNTLIPRPETEYLVNAAVNFLQDKESWLVADIWTGCWIIWIWTAYKLWENNHKWILSDISANTIEVAKLNWQRILKNQKAKFLVADLADFLLKEKNWNICILANLPYIPDNIFETETSDYVKNWEPSIAFLWWKDWLNLYRRLLEQLNKINQNIVVFFEMMDWQQKLLLKSFSNWQWNIIDSFHFNIKIVRGNKDLASK